MKCVRCNIDNNLKDRTANSGRCKSCSHLFVFEPTTMKGVKITDAFFVKVIADISAHNTLSFTSKQFLYLINKRLKRKPLNLVVIAFLYFSLSYWAMGFIGAFVSLLVLGIIRERRVSKPKIPDSFVISAEQMQGWLNTWVDINGQIDRLLPVPVTSIGSSVENNVQNSDVTDYSFDRLVVCNSPEIAQMLIANNFHFENNCAILSITGYPAAVFDTVLQMLRRNADLIVYAFHDASPDGVSLVHQLRTNPTWFIESTATIVELGLLPRQVLANSRNLFIHRTTTSATAATQLIPEIRQNLTQEELAWLDAGNYVELESFTPQRLIQILNRGIASSRELDTSNADTIWIDNSGSRVYSIESFG